MPRRIPALFLLACGHNAKDQTPDACTISVVGFDPADGDAEVPVDATIAATLSAADPSATLLLADAAGVSVPGQTRRQGATLRFTPDAPLATDSQYTATLRYCLDSPEPAVATASFDSPSTAGPAQGKSYRMDISRATWAEPAIGVFLSTYITSDLLLNITRQVGDSLEMRGATTISRGGPQDRCYSTMPFPEGEYNEEDGSFVVGPADITLTITGYVIPVYDMTFGGTLAADLGTLEVRDVSGQLNVNDLAPVFGPLLGTTDPDSICSTIAMFGDSCVTCNDGSSNRCIDVVLHNLSAAQVSDDDVACVALDACHPDCATSTCADPNEGVCD